MEFHDILTQQAFNSKTAVVYKKQEYSYSDLYTLSCKFANYLITNGINVGDRIALYTPNCIESIITMSGASMAGVIVVPINEGLCEDKVYKILSDTKPKLIIFDSCVSQIVNEFKSLVNGNKIKISSDWNNVLELEPIVPINRQCDTFAIIYTTGSTGTQKGVMIGHQQFVESSDINIKHLNITSSDITLTPVAISFGYSLQFMYQTLMVGGTVILESNFKNINYISRQIISHKVTILPAVPMLLTLLYSKISLFTNLKLIATAGCSVPTPLLQHIRKVLPETEFYSLYGLTETLSVLGAKSYILDNNPNSLGNVTSDQITAYLIDDNGNIITTPNTIGELIINSPSIMKGYWNNPEETEKTFKINNSNQLTLHTGDFFIKDVENNYQFMGRRDGIIKIQGEKVVPRAIELVVQSMKDITDAVVVPILDKRVGYRLMLHVISKKDFELNGIRQYCRKTLGSSHMPSDITYWKEFPLNHNGKVDYSRLQ